MYLEENKVLELTKQNKQNILNALLKINGISNDKNIKVAYIKILANLLKFQNAIENFFYLRNPRNNTIFQKNIEKGDNTTCEFEKIKSSLKEDFNNNNFDLNVSNEFFSLIENIENNIVFIFKDEKFYEFNNYLIELINQRKLVDFIWLNTIYNIYKENQSLKDIVNKYKKFSYIEFQDLYKLYLFVTDFNINELLLKGASKIINDEYLEDINKFFDFMYDLVYDMKNFISKEKSKEILSFSEKYEAYTHIKTPTKQEFLKIIKKVFIVLRDLYQDDKTKLLLNNSYPLLVKSFYAPLKNNDKIRYEYSKDFIYALEYIQIIIEVMSEAHV